MLAWLPSHPGREPRAVALEVKSSADGTFFLSSHEWSTACSLAEDAIGTPAYGVFVVRRGKGSEPPTALELLPDPVALVASGQLSRAPDVLRLGYTVTHIPSGTPKPPAQ